jgi:hypothetical protein
MKTFAEVGSLQVIPILLIRSSTDTSTPPGIHTKYRGSRIRESMKPIAPEMIEVINAPTAK